MNLQNELLYHMQKKILIPGKDCLFWVTEYPFKAPTHYPVQIN